ncbi:hypothetical protein CPB83DRAFT_840860 [Crepidotus variabilis]|uniref:DNA 3'-5' helicase n=1 Tax=Crepidotus variabilis TaxID=179855 RepID=A0A9P6E3Q6_9AGAR|nr:hypothetical protein CPB83DRAFT_840860 [Crepidotus variabilis]
MQSSANKIANNCKKGDCEMPVYTQQKDFHNRVYHQTTTEITHAGRKITIVRDAMTKHFHCPECNKHSYRDPESLRSHLANCENSATFKEAEYIRTPCAQTITTLGRFNLLTFNVVVSSALKAVVCVQCHKPILPATSIPSHIRTHLPELSFPSDLYTLLTERVTLSPDINFPSEIIQPVYGIPILETIHFFCDACNRGYKSLDAVKSHQTKKKCSPELRYHRGYGQLIHVTHRRIIEVDITSLVKRTDPEPNHDSWLIEGITPAIDYSKITVAVPEDASNLNVFFSADGWLQHIRGHTPEALYEARRDSQEVDPYSDVVRRLSQQYLSNFQPIIQDKVNFGLLRKIGSTTPDKKFNFRRLKPSSVVKYSLVIHKLVFNCLRYYTSKTMITTFKYPELDSSQLDNLCALQEALQLGKSDEELLPLFDTVLFGLFAHKKHEYESSRKASKFFSPVISFIVLHCITEKGGTPMCSGISNVVAPVMYAIRRSILAKALQISANGVISDEDAVAHFEDYLLDGQSTPMSFAFNVAVLLRVLRQNEFNGSAFTYTDVLGTELSFQGHLLTLSNIKTMIEDHYLSYKSTLCQKAFFGDDIPPELLPEIELEKLVDDCQCHVMGYSFLDDPRNKFDQHKSKYGKWLLSDPSRRSNFLRIEGSQIFWNTRPLLLLLKSFQAVELDLAAGLVLSAGPSARGTEVGRQLLRERPGCFRNLGLVLHHLSLNSTTDKSSHQQLLDKFVPHIPSREWAVALIQYLITIRPFAVYIVKEVLQYDDDLVNRYLFCLWPGLKSTMTGEALKEKLCQITEKSLGHRYTLRNWRCLTTAILAYVADQELDGLTRQYFHDTANMHSTKTAIGKYGGNVAHAAASDSRVVFGCVKVGQSWQNRIGLKQQHEPKTDVPPTSQSMLGLHVCSTSESSLNQLQAFRKESVDAVASMVSESMASVARLYFPVPPVPHTSLHRVSDIEVHPSRLKALRLFLNDTNANWSCPEQAVFVEHLIYGRSNILGIIGTGFGKTTMIMFLAKCFAEGKIILVIMPLVALHEDFHTRALYYGLSASRWRVDQHFNPNASIITAAIEDLLNEDFINFALQLANENRLYRVGFEEIHKMWTDISYRPAFSFIHRIIPAGVPVFGTTGTLPEHLLGTLTKLTEALWTVVRMPSNRKELAYGVRRIPKGTSVRDAVVAYWKEVQPTYSPQDRCIVFCQTVQDSETIAKMLQVTPYNSDSENDEPVRKFVRGDQVILPATMKLGCGFHYPHVRDVIHLDLAYSIVDQLQEDSRGGRDGFRCNAITFVTESKSLPYNNSEYDLGATAVYNWSQQSDVCRRVVPSLFLDNVPITCFLLPDAQLCDYCESKVEQPPPDSLRWLPLVNNVQKGPTSTALSQTSRKRLPIHQESAHPSKKPRTDSDPFV